MIKRKQTGTLAEVEEQFLATKKAQGVTDKTIKGYKETYALFKHFDTPIDSIDEQFIIGWISEMQQTKKPTTINHYIRDMRALLYYAMDQNFMSRFNVKTVKAQEPSLKLYSTDDLKNLLQKPRRDASFTMWRDWAIINTFLATGCRAGTLCEMQISDLDFAASEITYRHLKTRQTAIIPMSPQLKTALQDYLSLFNLDSYVFPLQDGNINSASSIRCSMLTYFRQRGVDYNGLHTFRHTYAKMYINNGGNAFTLQKMLCHSDITMTQRYVHLFADDLKNGYDKISPLDNLAQTHKISRR